MRNRFALLWITLFCLRGFAAPIDDFKADLQKRAWMENPAANDSTGTKSLEMAVSLGGKYFQLPFLMSEKSKVVNPAQSPALQTLIDSSFAKIFSTPTGKSICILATVGKPDLMVHQFGVSNNFAQKWAAHCAPEQAMTIHYRANAPRSYVALYSEDRKNPAEGWTNSFGVTFLPLIPEDLTEDHFVQILAHELAVKFDRKETVGVFYKLDGLDLAGQSECEILNIVRNPIVKYAFVASRAHQVEDQIAREMGQSVPKNQMSCADQVKNEIPAIIRLIPLVQTELLIKDALASISQCRNSNIDWFEAIDRLEKINLCDYFNAPDIGENSTSPTVGGPRPRVTGGWGDMKINSLNPSDRKALDAWLTQPQMQAAPNFGAWDKAVQQEIEKSKPNIEVKK